MEIARKLLVVYYKNNQVIRKLAKYGHLDYVSKRLKYAYIYVDAKDIKPAMNALKQIHGVTRVEESLVEMETYNFSL